MSWINACVAILPTQMPHTHQIPGRSVDFSYKEIREDIGYVYEFMAVRRLTVAGGLPQRGKEPTVLLTVVLSKQENKCP